MTTRIYTAYHGEHRPHSVRGPYVPLHVSATRGDDIACRSTYGEMRSHYLVWRNLLDGLEYVGFQQYRRWLRLDLVGWTIPAPHSVDDTGSFRAFEATGMPSPNLSDYDVVAAMPWHFKRTIGEEYCAAHVAAHWSALLDEWPYAHDLAEGEHGYNVCNAFVMRAPIFDLYMTFWWDLAQRIERRIDIPHGYQHRTMAFLSERIFSLWLKEQRGCLRVAEVPLLMDTSRLA